MSQIIDFAEHKALRRAENDASTFHRLIAVHGKEAVVEAIEKVRSRTRRTPHPRTVERMTVRALMEKPERLTVQNLAPHHGRIKARVLNRAAGSIVSACERAIHDVQGQNHNERFFLERYLELYDEALGYITHMNRMIGEGRAVCEARLAEVRR